MVIPPITACRSPPIAAFRKAVIGGITIGGCLVDPLKISVEPTRIYVSRGRQRLPISASPENRPQK